MGSIPIVIWLARLLVLALTAVALLTVLEGFSEVDPHLWLPCLMWLVSIPIIIRQAAKLSAGFAAIAGIALASGTTVCWPLGELGLHSSVHQTYTRAIMLGCIGIATFAILLAAAMAIGVRRGTAHRWIVLYCPTLWFEANRLGADLRSASLGPKAAESTFKGAMSSPVGSGLTQMLLCFVAVVVVCKTAASSTQRKAEVLQAGLGIAILLFACNLTVSVLANASPITFPALGAVLGGLSGIWSVASLTRTPKRRAGAKAAA